MIYPSHTELLYSRKRQPFYFKCSDDKSIRCENADVKNMYVLEIITCYGLVKQN